MTLAQSLRACSRPTNYERNIERHGYPFYWDAKEWKINVGDYILSFGVDEAGIETDGISRVQALIDNGAIIAIEYVKNPFGLRFSRGDEHKLEKCVEYLIQSGHLRVDGPLISIEKFAQALLHAPGVDFGNRTPPEQRSRLMASIRGRAPRTGPVPRVEGSGRRRNGIR
jgi:hypothetical protein